jgi:hypothetical protein
MTQRERNLALIAGVMAGVLGLLGLVVLYKQYTSLDDDVLNEQTQVQEAEAKILKAKADAPKLEHWRRLSLASDVATARDEYKAFLRTLMHKTGVTLDQFPPTPTDTKSPALLPGKNKQPIWTGLNFNLRVKARMDRLVKFLEEFQKAPRMHRIKSMVIERTDNSAKKDPLGMTVQLGIEALIILDADKDLKKAAGGNKDLWRQKLGVADMVMGLERRPVGLFTAAWALGPTGFVIPPLNPPLATRNYADIANKNIFIATAPPDDGPRSQATPDEMINRMRYNRLIGVVGTDGKIEGRFWDASTNRYTKANAQGGGYDKIPLVQSGPVEVGDDYVQLVVVNAIVKKVEDRRLVFQVSINYGDPIKTQWWRYPNDSNYYKLHKDDAAELIKKNKVRADDRDHLYVVGKRYWSDLIRDRKIVMTGKYYAAQTDGSRGEVVLEDSAVVVIRPESWPPQAAFEANGVAANRLYPDPFRIYGIDESHFDFLLAASKVKKEDIDDLYVMSPEYWDLLRDDQLIRQEGGSSYVIYKNLVKIEVVDRTLDMVVFRVPKKFCQFPGIAKTDDRPAQPSRWHEGYCILRMGNMVQDALLEPLPDEELNKLRPPPAGTTGN